MNQLLKNSGIILILIAVVIISLDLLNNLNNNLLLGISLLFIVFGLSIYILLQKFYD